MKTNSRVLSTGLFIAALAAPAATAQAESFATAAMLARADVQAQLQAYGVLIVLAGVVFLAVAGVVAMVKKVAS
jgi:hypothetical protein